MTKLKLFGFAYVLCFTITLCACKYFKLPLVFSSKYSAEQLLLFAALIAVLAAALVFINLPLLKWLKQKLAVNTNPLAWYLVSTLIVLQLVTLGTGYIESFLYGHGDFLYYYKGVTNSHIYVVSGNITAVFIAWFYGQSQAEKISDHPDILDSGSLS